TGEMVQRLKIRQALIAPSGRIARLDRQSLRHFMMSLRIDLVRERRPYHFHRFCPPCPFGVMEAHLLPDRPPGLHPVFPRHMMKPEQVFFRTRAHIVELLTERRSVLRRRPASTPGRSIESDPLRIGVMVIRRREL